MMALVIGRLGISFNKMTQIFELSNKDLKKQSVIFTSVHYFCSYHSFFYFQSCEELKSTLENRDFKDFTLQLEGLISIYNLNADQKVKSKAFTSLQNLETDIVQLAELQCMYIKDPFDIIHKSDVGFVQKRRGGSN